MDENLNNIDIESPSLKNVNIISNNNSNNNQVSDEVVCRYCYLPVETEENNFSSCKCKSSLCRDCLLREVLLSKEQNNNTPPQCTVCHTSYEIESAESSNTKLQQIWLNLQIIYRLIKKEELWCMYRCYMICTMALFMCFHIGTYYYEFIQFGDDKQMSLFWFVYVIQIISIRHVIYSFEKLSVTMPVLLLINYCIKAIFVISLMFIVNVSLTGTRVVSFIIVVLECSTVFYHGKQMLSPQIKAELQVKYYGVLVNGKGPLTLSMIESSHNARLDEENDEETAHITTDITSLNYIMFVWMCFHIIVAFSS